APPGWTAAMRATASFMRVPSGLRPPMAPAILIVDDDPVQRRLLEAAVTKFGHVPTVADNGEAAVSLLTGPDGDRFQLVVLDLVMPELDGMGVLSRLRQ